MQDEKKLKVQQRALDYVEEVYRFSLMLPDSEKYNLISQIRRAATSIPLNISEGAASNSKKEFKQFLSIAYRSAKEVLTCFELIERLHSHKHLASKINELKIKGDEICKMTHSLRMKLTTEN